MGEDQYLGSRKSEGKIADALARASTSCGRSIAEIHRSAAPRDAGGAVQPGISTGFTELSGGSGAARIAGQASERGVGVELRRFVHDESGQGLVEYALIIAVIAVAVIVAMIFLRDQLTNIFSTVGNNLT